MNKMKPKCKANFEDIADALDILLRACNNQIDNGDYGYMEDIIKRLKESRWS